jgi:TM2 domain-containing membrane protein YozV
MSQGTTGNVIAALASFFLPRLGQLLQGRVLAAIFYFILSGVIWVVTLGFWVCSGTSSPAWMRRSIQARSAAASSVRLVYLG